MFRVRCCALHIAAECEVENVIDDQDLTPEAAKSSKAGHCRKDN
jgi:hypothetical protein